VSALERERVEWAIGSCCVGKRYGLAVCEMGRREKRKKRRERRQGGPHGEWAERPAVAAVLKKKT
jgi:hypothetical protein